MQPQLPRVRVLCELPLPAHRKRRIRHHGMARNRNPKHRCRLEDAAQKIGLHATSAGPRSLRACCIPWSSSNSLRQSSHSSIWRARRPIVTPSKAPSRYAEKRSRASEHTDAPTWVFTVPPSLPPYRCRGPSFGPWSHANEFHSLVTPKLQLRPLSGAAPRAGRPAPASAGS